MKIVLKVTNSNMNSCWDAILSDSDDEFNSFDQDTTSDGRDTINSKVKREILLYFTGKRMNREVGALLYWRELKFVPNDVYTCL